MNSSFYISVDLDLKTLSSSTVILEELLTAFIESTQKQKRMSNASFKVQIWIHKLGDSVSPGREQKPNRVD